MSETMSKKDLVETLAIELDCDKSFADRALGAVSEIVTRQVAAGGTVTLPGVAKFSCADRPERDVRNPRTGEMMKKPADKAVKVTLLKTIKERVNA